MMKRSLFSDQRGQALIEAAVAIIFLIPIMLGAVDLGAVLQDYQELATAADAGAAYAASDGSNTDADLAGTQTYACGVNQPGGTGSCSASSWRSFCQGGLGVTLGPPTDDTYGGDSVTVSVECTVVYPIPLPALPKSITSVTLQNSVTKRVHSD
jgi:Flp pilus assembly protein TadG